VNDGTLEAWIETSARTLVDEFEQLMSQRAGAFADRETAALALANAVARLWTQSELQRMASRYEDEILVGRQRYRRHAAGTLRYHTLSGPIEVSRDTYRQIGVHNGPTVVPLEIDAGIFENATPALAHSVLQAFATMPLRHYEDEMRAAHRRVPSRSTLERIAKRVARDIHDELPVIEPALRAEEIIPREAASLSIGVDRTTIPMAEPLPVLPDYWYRKLKRRPPPPIIVAFRMAYIATLAINDSSGKTISSKRVAATAEEGPGEMMERLIAEVHYVLAARPRLPVIVVQDGAPELWSLVDEGFSDAAIPIAMKLIDRYHLEQRLAALAEIVEPQIEARRRLRKEWSTALDRGDKAVGRICKHIKSQLWRAGPFNRNLAEGHLAYCRRYEDKMRYATARRRGFAIGSGVTEGACKSVIASRMKRSGQRWFENGASACLQMRSLYLNGRLERSVNMHRDRRRETLRCV
jgi:hypothetical protein